ncbi:MAG: polysaccharide pyruvyl transferase family protein, partial [Acidimicrobiia bacterium]|nr:polysaccharide pyruvyl transferase family protein [Acidimicrobiia bacterium]
MRIALTGYYGFGNAGDDAILQSIVAVLRRAGVTDVTVITYPGGDLDDVRRLAAVHAVDGADLEEVDRAIGRADRLVIGGGGLIQDYLPTDPDDRFSERHSNLGFWSTLAILARAKGVPTMTWALGVGPLSTDDGRAEASLFFSAVDLVTVRDPESAELARSLGAADPKVVADPAVLLEPADDDPIAAEAEVEDLPTSGAKKIVVSVRHWDDDRWMDPLAEALDRLVDEIDADVIFVPFQHSGRGLANDVLVSTRVAARMRNRARRAVLGTELSPTETLAAIGSADLLIGMRLHSVIFAATTGVPSVAMAYDPKVRVAMERLGLGSQVVDLGGVTSDWLVEAASAAAPPDPALVAELQAAARQSAGLLGMVTAAPVGALTPVAVDAAVRRASEARALRVERDEAQAAHNQAAMERDNLTEAYDKLAAEYQTFLDSR